MLIGMLIGGMGVPVGARLSHSLPASDDFNRSNESPMAGNWSTPASGADPFFLSSNVVQGTGASNENYGYWNADVFPDDQFSQATLVSNTSSFDCGVSVRVSTSTASSYSFGNRGNTATTGIFKIASGTFTLLLTSGTPVANGDVLKITAAGTTLEGFINGVSIGTTTDATYTSGSAGLNGYGSGGVCAFDDWSGGAVGGGGGGSSFGRGLNGPQSRGGGGTSWLLKGVK